jgi:aminoglycoside/choline kinase family phosphotransferase
MVQFDNRAFFEAGAANAAADALDNLYDTPDLTKEVMSYLANDLDPVLEFFSSRPFTFVHGDFHAKQMFFPTQQGGEFAVIDWQFPFVAQGAWDFARMLGMCMPADVRRAEEQTLLGSYLDSLASLGVQNYFRADLEIDYCMGFIISQMIMSVAAADTDAAYQHQYL